MLARLLVILLLTAVACGQAVRHVPAQFPTIQGAIVAAFPGDVVCVQPGVYVENLDFLGKAITVQSAMGAATTVIDGGQAGSVVRFESGETRASVLHGFTLQNGLGGAGSLGFGAGGGVQCALSSPTIVDCRVTGNVGGTSTITGAAGGIQINGGAPLIDRCLVLANLGGDAGIVGPGAGGIALESTAGVVRNSVIANNVGGGGTSGPVPSIVGSINAVVGGILARQSGAASIIHCTVTQNVAVAPAGFPFNGAPGGLVAISASSTIVDSIFWNDVPVGTPSSDEIGGAAVLTFCDIDGGLVGAGNIDADPLFVDPANDDFHLQPSSPCRDAGCGNVGTSLVDLDGDARLIEVSADIGADEVLGTAPLMPGSAEDLQLITVIDGAGNPFQGAKAVVDGNFLAMALYTPCGTLGANAAAIAAQLWFGGSPPAPIPGFPELHLDQNAFVALGPLPLGPTGLSLGFSVPGSFLVGFVLRVQGVAIGAATKNGTFAASDAHDIVFQ